MENVTTTTADSAASFSEEAHSATACKSGIDKCCIHVRPLFDLMYIRLYSDFESNFHFLEGNICTFFSFLIR